MSSAISPSSTISSRNDVNPSLMTSSLSSSVGVDEFDDEINFDQNEKFSISSKNRTLDESTSTNQNESNSLGKLNSNTPSGSSNFHLNSNSAAAFSNYPPPSILQRALLFDSLNRIVQRQPGTKQTFSKSNKEETSRGTYLWTWGAGQLKHFIKNIDCKNMSITIYNLTDY